MTRWIVTLATLAFATVGMGQELAGTFHSSSQQSSQANPASIAVLIIGIAGVLRLKQANKI